MKKLILTLGLLLLMAGQAQALSYYAVAKWNLQSLDSSAIPFDSVIFILLKTRADTTTAGLDSATAHTSTASVQHKPRRVVWGHLGEDSLTYGMEFVDSMLVAGTVPIGIAVAFTDATPGPSLQVRAHLDFTRVLDPSGSGENICSLFVLDTVNAAIVVGAGVQVKTEDGTAFIGGKQVTKAAGVVVYSLDNTAGSGYQVFVSSSLFFQPGAFQLVTVSGATLDTLRVGALVVTAPTGPDSCTVVIFTDSPGAQAEFTPSSTKHQNIRGRFLNTRMVPKTGDSNGTIQLGLPKTDSTMRKSTYSIKVFSSDPGRPMIFSLDNYVVPNQTTDTVFVESR